MQDKQTINRAELEQEAARWGGADFYTGDRESECPYSDKQLAAIWLEAYRYCQAHASRFERAVAWLARAARIKIFQ